METKILEAEQVHLDETVLAVCKSFTGSFDEITAFTGEVKSHLSDSDVNFNEEKAIFVFNDLKKNFDRNNLRIYAGFTVENELHEDPPYFVYHLNEGRYLHTSVPSASFEDISPAVESLLHEKNHKGPTGTSTVILISCNGNLPGTREFDLYVKLKDNTI